MFVKILYLFINVIYVLYSFVFFFRIDRILIWFVKERERELVLWFNVWLIFYCVYFVRKKEIRNFDVWCILCNVIWILFSNMVNLNFLKELDYFIILFYIYDFLCF